MNFLKSSNGSYGIKKKGQDIILQTDNDMTGIELYPAGPIDHYIEQIQVYTISKRNEEIGSMD
ncbi:MAG: hypothetical protein U5K69_26760 [Balneolaceae bacterium]|nr:hypothetical protein [Balneolaceae bacterium]